MSKKTAKNTTQISVAISCEPQNWHPNKALVESYLQRDSFSDSDENTKTVDLNDF